MNDFKNILVVRTDRMGDVIVTTPCLTALRKNFPNSKISILVSSMTKALVEENPFVDEIFVDDKNDQHKGVFGFFRLVNLIRQQKFDVALILHTKRRTNLLCFLAGIKKRVGYKNNKFGFLLNDQIKDERHFGKKHESEYCLDVMCHLGARMESEDLFLAVNPKDQEHAQAMLRELNIDLNKKIIAVHVGASDPAKCWPIEKFAELLDQIDEKYQVQFILVGSQDLEDLVNQLKEKIKKARFFDLIGKTTVKQLMAVLSQMDMLISNDSGPVHVAAALKVPVISIFTRNCPGINPERWKPLGEKSCSVAISTEEMNNVIPSAHSAFQKAGLNPSEYLHILSVDRVMQSVDSLFKLC